MGRPSSGIRRVSARQGWVGEKSGLFEHPAGGSPVILDMRTSEDLASPRSFPQLARVLPVHHTIGVSPS
jgi:hypothetical protein